MAPALPAKIVSSDAILHFPNKALSLRRAASVARMLIAAGVSAAKVISEGFGPDEPLADNATREGQTLITGSDGWS